MEEEQTGLFTGDGLAVFELGDGVPRGVVLLRNPAIAPGDDADIQVGRADLRQAGIERTLVLGHEVLHGDVLVAHPAEEVGDPAAAGLQVLEGGRDEDLGHLRPTTSFSWTDDDWGRPRPGAGRIGERPHPSGRSPGHDRRRRRPPSSPDAPGRVQGATGARRGLGPAFSGIIPETGQPMRHQAGGRGRPDDRVAGQWRTRSTGRGVGSGRMWGSVCSMNRPRQQRGRHRHADIADSHQGARGGDGLGGNLRSRCRSADDDSGRPPVVALAVGSYR